MLQAIKNMLTTGKIETFNKCKVHKDIKNTKKCQLIFYKLKI